MIGRRTSPATKETDKPKGFDGFELKLGDVMRGERATLSKSLLDVQRDLKIKASYIAAIENTDVAAFETPGFIAGYVRSYARYLGLDPEWAFARFCEEANFAPAHGLSAVAQPAKPAPLPRKGADFTDPLANPNALFVPRGKAFLSHVEPGAVGSVLVLLALVAGIGYGGWSVLQEVQKVRLAPVDEAPGVVAELDPLRSATDAPKPVLSSEAAVQLPSGDALERLYRPEALDAPVLIARDGPIASIDPTSVGALAGMAPAAPAPASAGDAGAGIDAALAEAMGAGTEPVVRTVVAEAPALQIVASRPSWIRISAADGSILFEKVLDAGERYTVPTMDQPPTLRAGNSTAIYFAMNGQTYGPASPSAQVVKNLPLTPESLLKSFPVADVGRDPDLARIVAVAEADLTPAGQ